MLKAIWKLYEFLETMVTKKKCIGNGFFLEEISINDRRKKKHKKQNKKRGVRSNCDNES